MESGSPSGQYEQPKKKKSRSITWDEDNLEYNETHKTATMKIDEPPTPYNYYREDEDEELQAMTDDLSLGNKGKGKGVKIRDGSVSPTSRGSDGLANLGRLEEAFSLAAGARERMDDDNAADSPENHRKFEAKRKAHYNEFKLVQQMRMEDEDDEDDETQ